MKHDWDEHYEAGEARWDTGRPAPTLVELVEAGRLPPGRALEIGCGTGTNARYLASRGYDVLGIDVSRLAIERAAAAALPAGGSVELRQLDFLLDEPPAGPFDLAFDRGCFHVFDDPDEQRAFAERVAGCLAPGGLWVSLLGSTEGPPRDEGPPRRSARDVVNAQSSGPRTHHRCSRPATALRAPQSTTSCSSVAPTAACSGTARSNVTKRPPCATARARR